MFKNFIIALKGHFGIGRPNDDKYCHCYCYFWLPCASGWRIKSRLMFLWLDIRGLVCKVRGRHWDIPDVGHADEPEKGYVWCKICNRGDRTTKMSEQEIAEFHAKYPWFQESIKILKGP